MRRSRNSCEFLLKRRFVHTAGSSSRNCVNKTIPNQKQWTRNYIRSRIYVKFQYYYVHGTDWLKNLKNNYDLEQMFSNQTMVQGHLVQAMSNQASGFSDLQCAQSPQWPRSLDGGHTRLMLVAAWESREVLWPDESVLEFLVFQIPSQVDPPF